MLTWVIFRTSSGRLAPCHFLSQVGSGRHDGGTCRYWRPPPWPCVLLPVEDTLGRSNTVPRRYEAEHTPARCTVLPRGGASNGHSCRQDANNVFAVAGPFVTLEPGQYQIIAGGEAGDRPRRWNNRRGRQPGPRFHRSPQFSADASSCLDIGHGGFRRKRYYSRCRIPDPRVPRSWRLDYIELRRSSDR